MDSMGKATNILSTNYENFLLVGDFNVEESNNSVKNFCDVYGFTFYKNPNNPKCIDLMLANKNRCFQNSVAIETGLSDVHKKTALSLNVILPKQSRKSYFIWTINISPKKVLDHLFLTRMETYKIIMY